MSERSGTVAGLERALDVLTLFAQSERASLGVSEIARELRLPKAVVHRILASFVAKGFVEVDRDTRRYSLGPSALVLGLSYLDRVDLGAVARDAMRELVAATDETATLSVRAGWTRVYIDQVLPDRDVKMVVQLGRPFPLHAGASSKAFLAFLGDDEQEEYLTRASLERLTTRTVTSASRLRRELAVVRRQGYAVSMGERDAGAAAVAAPVFGFDGRPQAVISVSGPLERFRDEAEAAARLLVDATGRVSQRLGHRTA